jgi:MarR family transcriptional regulator, organic hydroperoxide resistance regulator
MSSTTHSEASSDQSDQSDQSETLDPVVEALRTTLHELFGAERRLRGRDQQQSGAITSAQFRAVRLLDEVSEATAGELARTADLNPASVTAMLDQLELAGVVERRRSTQDRRVCMVSLTDAGRTMLHDKRDRSTRLWNERFADVPEEDLAAGMRVMRDLMQLFDVL